MKLRKLAVALALAGGLGSGVVQALGLGEIELQSYLNEPLNAEIALRKTEGVNPEEVSVSLASEADYSRVGIDRNYFLSKLEFDVATTANGNLVVNVSSQEALREPYLSFLLEVTWPSGRLMREYAVLVDPPIYAEGSGVREPVQPPPAAPSAAPVRSADRNVRQTEGSAPRSAPGTYGATGPADTLWAIAIAVRPDRNLAPQQVMLALQDLNPDAFTDGNINRLKRGEVLRIPDLGQIQQRTRAEASRQVSNQNEALAETTREVDATGQDQGEPQAQVAGSTPASGSELKLLVAGEASAAESRESGSAGGDDQLSGGSDIGTDTAIVLKELEGARRENAELSDRMTDLQDQVETLQRLVELKNNQLADLQGLSAGETGEADVLVAGRSDAGNPLYQLALGGGPVLLLLLLLLLARRNADRKKEFFEQFDNGPDESSDSDSTEDTNLALDDEQTKAASEQGEANDRIAEADTYIAYGRVDPAVQALSADEFAEADLEEFSLASLEELNFDDPETAEATEDDFATLGLNESFEVAGGAADAEAPLSEDGFDLDDFDLDNILAGSFLIGDSSEDDEEDFDFLDGTDEAATKLDLARAYVEMGDAGGAKGILQEVAVEGTDEQKDEAHGLLQSLA